MKIQNSADNQERSKPHRRVESILERMGLSYLSEHPFPPYKVDIYLPEWHVAIEVDGPFHNMRKDVTRDAWLEAFFGLKILRVNARKWLRQGPLEKEILAFIEEQADSSLERKEKWLTRR